jgi:hypothetical protein
MPMITVKDCLNCGVDHEWVFTGVTLKELRDIKSLTGMSQKQFAEAGDEGDPEALAALLYILHKRDKIKVLFDDVDLDFSGFSMELTKEEQAEQDELEAEMARAAEAEQAPKVRPSSTRKSGPSAKAASAGR